MGHVRDLPAKTLGVDVARDFAPLYEVLPRAQKALTALRRAAAGAEGVLLATDPDREGEAIAWHLAEALRLPKSRYRRITFHEISRRAIQEALAHPRDLDPHLIDAQQARRVLDRLVGYQLSPLLWHKVQRGTSAGRVQSVAVKLVVDREREIDAFVPQEYWTIDVRLSPEATPSAPAGPEDSFLARLQEVDGKKAAIADGETARALEAQLRRAAYWVRETAQKTLTRTPFPPFTTSTLQQAAGNRLRFPAKKTMAAAQALYEAGLITYMRTDSVAVAPAAVSQARQVIAEQFGPQYVPDAPRRYSTRTKNAQEAHEAVRPVDLAKTPATLRGTLAPDEWRIYDLVWKRMIASQMAPARYLQDLALVDAATGDPPRPAEAGGEAGVRRFLLKAQATVLIFPGWLAAYGEDPAGTPRVPAGRGTRGRAGGTGRGSAYVAGDEGSEPGAAGGEAASTEAPANDRLPALVAGQPLRLEDVLPEQHFTQPPRRYTEAALVKALEEHGVGRPSTYATVVSTIQDRGYVRLDQRHFVPTDLGFAANDFLVAHFPRIVDLPFTAAMEDQLDEIAGGRLAWTEMLRAFYGPFAQTVTLARGASATPLKLREREGSPPFPAPAAERAPRTTGPARAPRAPRAAGPPRASRGARETGAAGPAPASRSTRASRSARPARVIRGTPEIGAAGSAGGTPARRAAPPPPTAAASSAAASVSASAAPACPQCGRPLVPRQSQFGPFLGCSGFPACRYIHRDPATDPTRAPRLFATRVVRAGRRATLRSGNGA